MSGGRSVTVISGPVASAMARSSTRTSWRTLPGQSYDMSASHADADSLGVVGHRCCCEEVVDEQRNVLAPRAQRRDDDLDAGKPIVEVRAKSARRRRDRGDSGWSPRPRVCRPCASRCPPTRSIVMSCSTRSSLACAAGERSPTSSRKSVPAIRELELAATAPHAGRRALLDAEQLGLDQRLDQRRAVDGHERPALPAAAHVQVLARPAPSRRRSRPRSAP